MASVLAPPLLATAPISILLLILLMAIFAASLSVFLVLTHRWTSHRKAIELADWAREHGFTLRSAAKATLPAPLATQKTLDAQARWLISNETTSMVCFMTVPGDAGAMMWNVLVRRTISNWPTTGLRPANAGASVIDFFNLTTIPHLAPSERFLVVGGDRAAARKLAESHARALLPADIGLLRVGEYLVLDFSGRPFDPIEFGRMLAVVDQVERVI
jgi:hypothetical protein